MRITTARAYDLRVEQLFDKMRRIHAALEAAEIPYRIVGGMGVFLQVHRVDPDVARLTPNLDLAVRENDLQRITIAAQQGGLSLSCGRAERVDRRF